MEMLEEKAKNFRQFEEENDRNWKEMNKGKDSRGEFHKLCQMEENLEKELKTKADHLKELHDKGEQFTRMEEEKDK